MNSLMLCLSVWCVIIVILCWCHSASDCFELGRLAYLEKDYYHTVLWMNEALSGLDNDKEFYAAVLDYLAYATYMVS